MITTNRTTRARQRLEQVMDVPATPFPLERPRRLWPLVVGGITIGLLLGQLHRWAVAPIAPVKLQPKADKCLGIHLPALRPEQLEPQWTAETRARYWQWYSGLTPSEKAEQLRPIPQAPAHETNQEENPCG